MVLKGRKFKVSINSILPCDAKELYEHISAKHAVNYVGVYSSNEDKIVVYANFKNAVESSRIRVFMDSIDVSVGKITKYQDFEGELQSEHGKLFSIGRPTKRKSPSNENPPTVINNNTTINNDHSVNNIDNSVNTNINVIVVNPIGQE